VINVAEIGEGPESRSLSEIVAEREAYWASQKVVQVRPDFVDQSVPLVPKADVRGGNGGTRTSGRYPWQIWADGDWHDIEEGTDFEMPVERFRTQLYNYARRHNMQVETMVTDRDRGILTFCFHA
jgi:hypothetical protein